MSIKINIAPENKIFTLYEIYRDEDIKAFIYNGKLFIKLCRQTSVSLPEADSASFSQLAFDKSFVGGSKFRYRDLALFLHLSTGALTWLKLNETSVLPVDLEVTAHYR